MATRMGLVILQHGPSWGMNNMRAQGPRDVARPLGSIRIGAEPVQPGLANVVTM